MCTSILFKTERKVVDSIGGLAEMVGGFDAIVPYDWDDYPDDMPLRECGGECLCHIDLEATLKSTVYSFAEDWDPFQFSAWKPDWLVEQEKRAEDRRRYEAAMAETRAGRDSDTRQMAETGTGSGRSPGSAVPQGNSPSTATTLISERGR